jgi:hypothetical protein
MAGVKRSTPARARIAVITMTASTAHPTKETRKKKRLMLAFAPQKLHKTIPAPTAGTEDYFRWLKAWWSRVGARQAKALWSTRSTIISTKIAIIGEKSSAPALGTI